MINFFRRVIQFMAECDIPYMLSGSVAMSLYVLPRATRDFEFVADITSQDVDKLVGYFKHGYYCDYDAVCDAVKNRTMFNIIDHSSGFKADFVILKHEEFRQTEFSRSVKGNFFDTNIFVVTAEDLLISKLIWIQDVQSGLQMEDIKLLSRKTDLDWEYIRHWLGKMQLKTFNLINT